MKSESKDKVKSREEVWDKAFMAMCKGLDAYGPGEILNILVENARHDEIVFQLLVRFPTTVSLGEFLATLRTVKVSKRLFNKLQREDCII